METMLAIHSWVRWLVILVMVASAVKFALGLLRNQAFGTVDRMLVRSLNALLGLQLLLGVGLLFSLGVVRYRLEHATAMVIAIILFAVLSVRWKKTSDRQRYRNFLILLLIILTTVFLGISRLPGVALFGLP